MNPSLQRRCDRFIENSRFHPERIRVFAQGDSWLSLPGGLWSGRNVAENLASSEWAEDNGREPMNVLSVANPGKTLEKMASDPDLLDVLTYLQLRSERDQRHYGFDAVIITGGGNDVLDNPRALIGPGAGQGAVKPDMLAAALERIKGAWQSLFAVFGPWNVPIMSHGYGPIFPTLESATIVIPGKTIGPWVGPYLIRELGLSPARARALVAEVLDALNDTLRAMPGISYLDVRALVAAVPKSGWHDEIHFLEPGWSDLSLAWHDHITENAQAAGTAAATTRRNLANAIVSAQPLQVERVSALIPPTTSGRRRVAKTPKRHAGGDRRKKNA